MRREDDPVIVKQSVLGARCDAGCAARVGWGRAGEADQRGAKCSSNSRGQRAAHNDQLVKDASDSVTSFTDESRRPLFVVKIFLSTFFTTQVSFSSKGGGVRRQSQGRVQDRPSPSFAFLLSGQIEQVGDVRDSIQSNSVR